MGRFLFVHDLITRFAYDLTVHFAYDLTVHFALDVTTFRLRSDCTFRLRSDLAFCLRRISTVSKNGKKLLFSNAHTQLVKMNQLDVL